MKRFLIRTLLILFPALLAMMAINYKGDAANLFAAGYEKNIVQTLLGGRNITNVYDYNERLVQKYLIENSDVCPEVIALGSSRVMQINASHFPGHTFLNNGVSGASIEDLCGIVQIYEEKNCLPKRIVWGLDPWTLNARSEQDGWKTLYLEYKRFLRRIAGQKTNPGNDAWEHTASLFVKNDYMLQLLSPSYFKISLQKLLYPGIQPITTSSIINDGNTKLTDGSIYYGSSYRSATKEQVEQRAQNYVVGKIYGVEQFEEIDTDIQAKFEFLTEHLRSKGVQISFVLVPYHPTVFDVISHKEKYAPVLQSESYFRAFAAGKGIPLVGSFDPGATTFGPDDYYDGMHPSLQGIGKLMALLK